MHWVVQVIPYVSKGRSHGDYWFESSYVYFIILSQDINYNYQLEFQISAWRWCVPSESLLSYYIHPILLTPLHSNLYVGHHCCQWLHPILSVKKVQMLCHSTANHQSVINQVGIESLDSFASVTNA